MSITHTSVLAVTFWYQLSGPRLVQLGRGAPKEGKCQIKQSPFCISKFKNRFWFFEFLNVCVSFLVLFFGWDVRIIKIPFLQERFLMEQNTLLEKVKIFLYYSYGTISESLLPWYIAAHNFQYSLWNCLWRSILHTHTCTQREREREMIRQLLPHRACWWSLSSVAPDLNSDLVCFCVHMRRRRLHWIHPCTPRTAQLPLHQHKAPFPTWTSGEHVLRSLLSSGKKG